MLNSNPDCSERAETVREIQMLTLHDLDITELEERLELASALPADCWVNGPGRTVCGVHGHCAGNGKELRESVWHPVRG